MQPLNPYAERRRHESFRLPLLNIANYLERFVAGAIDRIPREEGEPCTLTVLAHGAGTQTSILLALASRAHRIAVGPGHLRLDLALFANVGDTGTESERPDTIRFLERLNWWSNVPLFEILPGDWNPTLQKYEEELGTQGIYDTYRQKEMIPLRAYRACSEHYKILPQLKVLESMREEAARRGVDLRFRQVLGFSSDEAHRAERFHSAYDWITPYFPLVEWGWTRGDTIEAFRKLCPDIYEHLGDPTRSSCFFCPFTRRGIPDPVTLEVPGATWTRLFLDQRALFEAAADLERASNRRREQDGKAPIYLYGNHPLPFWMSQQKRTVQMAMDYDELGEGDLPDDDECVSGYCFV